MALENLPVIKHPFEDITLSDAVELAIGCRRLCLEPAPTTLEEAREVVRVMAVKAGNWMTGLAALDVLDAAIEGRDLFKDSRYR